MDKTILKLMKQDKLEILELMKEGQKDFDEAFQQVSIRTSELSQVFVKWLVEKLLKAKVITEKDVGELDTLINEFNDKYMKIDEEAVKNSGYKKEE